ncbi:aldo/keto reductase [Streptomyces sp. NPDC093991]|uniref:aldo/keto reductase n=1 Tax=unclassified Streptomyces TaxID=2593676 RepID=UPI003417EEF1
MSGELALADSTLAEVAAELNATPAQVALAWLPDRPSVLRPVPGTSSVTHLEENVAASTLRLAEEPLARLAPLRLAEEGPARFLTVGSAQK